MSKVVKNPQICPQDQSKLSYIFRNQPSLAWDMLEEECNIYTSPNLDVEQINKLSSIYCKIVLKLNDLEDPRQKYFNNKMQKLMAQPFVIRCYTDCTQKKKLNKDLHQKRKQLQQKLSIQNQKNNNQAFQQLIQTQNEKQKKLKQKISQVIEQHEKNLQNRLNLRSMRKLLTSPKKHNSQDPQFNTSQNGDPETVTPKKMQNSEDIYYFDYTDTTDKNSQKKLTTRPQSSRFLSYKFSADSSSDSQDQYRLSKLIQQQKMQMGKRKQAEVKDQSKKPALK